MSGNVSLIGNHSQLSTKTRSCVSKTYSRVASVQGLKKRTTLTSSDPDSDADYESPQPTCERHRLTKDNRRKGQHRHYRQSHEWVGKANITSRDRDDPGERSGKSAAKPEKHVYIRKRFPEEAWEQSKLRRITADLKHTLLHKDLASDCEGDCEKDKNDSHRRCSSHNN